MTPNFHSYMNIHPNSTIVVLGLGPSLLEYEKYKNREDVITIGVNDIGRFMHPKYLFCADKPARFKDEKRRNTIQDNKSPYFISHLTDEWKFDDDKTIIKYVLGKTNLYEFEKNGYNDRVNISNNSTYMCCIIAYYFGAKNIALLGCDFTRDHYDTKDGVHALNNRLKEINYDFQNLYEKLKKNGCNLYNVSSNSNITALPKMPLDKFMEKFCPEN